MACLSWCATELSTCDDQGGGCRNPGCSAKSVGQRIQRVADVELSGDGAQTRSQNNLFFPTTKKFLKGAVISGGKIRPCPRRRQPSYSQSSAKVKSGNMVDGGVDCLSKKLQSHEISSADLDHELAQLLRSRFKTKGGASQGTKKTC